MSNSELSLTLFVASGWFATSALIVGGAIALGFFGKRT